ncbi:NUDIX domain-containing protein [Muriicola soli]|uniref:GDP-mannose pyrophosphatase n=1 Tax=Muriicola soli TaxID=2507538 RepID=A0A411E9X0_9FLAO|nr:NUDIX domain-containing protein [Muriicola soli]QBA64502.1 NUDIX domain-containing protein [Muriicola soli]
MKKGKIKNVKKEILSDQWYTLYRYTYDYQKEDGSWETQRREAYDRGNGAAILLYQADEKKVILTRQFRMPTYINANPTGMMVEVCAGMLDQQDPEKCIIREVEEETGYRVQQVKKVFEAYMSPGAVTEVLHFFIAPYDSSMKVNKGGGVAHETENIEVLEVDFAIALEMINSGVIKDAKTIMLLQYAELHDLL